MIEPQSSEELETQSGIPNGNADESTDVENDNSINNAEEQSPLKDGFLTVIEMFIKSTEEVDQTKLSPQFLLFITKLNTFVELTRDNYSFRYVFDLIAQHIKAIIYVNLNAPDILGEKHSSETYNDLVSALVSGCNSVIDTFIAKDIVINIEQAKAYAVNMPYHKADELINKTVGYEINIIEKSVEHYAKARRKREEENAEQQALVMQVMMLVGGLDYKNDIKAKRILIKYWPSKVNLPKKLNLNKVQQLSSIVATDLIVSKKTIQDFVSEFELDPELLEALKFTDEDLAHLNDADVTEDLTSQLSEENNRIDNMKQELIKDGE